MYSKQYIDFNIYRLLRVYNILVFIFALQISSFGQNSFINGYIIDDSSGEAIPFANIIILNDSSQVSANAYGYFKLSTGNLKDISLLVYALSYKTEKFQFSLKDLSGNLKLKLKRNNLTLDEVEIVDAKINRPSLEMLKEEIPLSAITNMPTILGEKDLLKTIQFLPGIQRLYEGSTAYLVRGGTADQNLILLDGATVYNPNHIFGFVSVFNGDAIKRADLWKSAIPARFGGRISSVLDVHLKEGNKEKFNWQAGVGILSSNFLIEGPLKKSKSSFFVSGRRSYLDLFLLPFTRNPRQNANFFDLNLKINTKINDRNRVFFSSYLGADNYSSIDEENRYLPNSYTKSTSNLGWGNLTTVVRWNHLTKGNTFINTSAIFNTYDFNFNQEELSYSAVDSLEAQIGIKSNLTDYTIKSELDKIFTNEHSVKLGYAYSHHCFNPRTAFQAENGTSDENGDQFYNNELVAYVEDNIKLKKIEFNMGLRLVSWLNTNKNRLLLEPRASATYNVNSDIKLLFSYFRTNQYIHLLSNTGLGLATDLWIPSSNKILPQSGDQISYEINYRNPKSKIEYSIAGYRKYMRNIIDYRDNALFLSLKEGVKLIPYEENTTTGAGLAFGNEFMAKKDFGKLTGWVSYTLSWVSHQFDEINNGKPFYPIYDRRHNFSVIANYSMSDKIKLSGTWVFLSGNRFTPSLGKYYDRVPTNFTYSGLNNIGNNLNRVSGPIQRSLFSKDEFTEEQIYYPGPRGWFKADNYHRLDISIQFHKTKKKFKRYWEIGVINAYNRKNPFSYSARFNGDKFSINRTTLIPILPFVSYNIKAL